MPSSAIDKHLGQRIQLARHGVGLTIEVMAEQVQYSVDEVSAMEAGSIRVPSLALARISRVVDQPLSWFFDGLPGQEVFDSEV